MSELEDILNYLETTSLEPHDDYVSEFSYKKQKILWSYIKELQRENQELKKQLDELQTLYNNMFKCHCNRVQVETLLEQQKEFIEYLEDKLNMCDGFLDTIKSDLEEISYAGRVSGKTYIANQIMKNETAMKCYEEVLSKYKEIVGGNNDQQFKTVCI